MRGKASFFSEIELKIFSDGKQIANGLASNVGLGMKRRNFPNGGAITNSYVPAKFNGVGAIQRNNEGLIIDAEITIKDMNMLE